MSSALSDNMTHFLPSYDGRGDGGRGLCGDDPHPSFSRIVGGFSWKLTAQLLVVLVAAGLVKQYYSTASVNQLRWILAPTTAAVELVTGSRFEFESYAGYVNGDHSFVIAASCAGVNFFLTAFLMLTLGKLWRSRQLAWWYFPAAAGIAYLTTIIANTVRISTALRLHGTSIDLGGMNPNQIHRLEGIVIYFGFLLLLFVVSERFARTDQTNSGGKTSLLRQSLFPLLVYYATTLGVPIFNSSLRGGRMATDFQEHSLFVLLAPLVLVLPLAILRLRQIFQFRKGRSHANSLECGRPRPHFYFAARSASSQSAEGAK